MIFLTVYDQSCRNGVTTIEKATCLKIKDRWDVFEITNWGHVNALFINSLYEHKDLIRFTEVDWWQEFYDDCVDSRAR